MTKLKDLRKSLLRKEEALKAQLNDSSEEVENGLFKVLKMAALGGLAGFIIYKAIAPSKKKKTRRAQASAENKTSKTKSTDEPSGESEMKLGSASTSGIISKNMLVEMGIKTLIPMGLKLLKEYLEKKEETSEKSTD